MGFNSGFKGLTFQSLLFTCCTTRFNIPEVYFLPTLYLCVLYVSQNKQRLLPTTFCNRDDVFTARYEMRFEIKQSALRP